jgi:tetratricopeptide (TPR) repeat protein
MSRPVHLLPSSAGLLVLLGATVGLTAACELRAPQSAASPALTARIAELERRARERADDRALQVELGVAHAEAGHYFEAADRLRAVVDANVRDGRAFLALSEVYEKLGYVDRGFEMLVRCVQETQNNEECLLRAAAVLRTDGSREGLVQAIGALERFLVIAPAHPRRAEAEKALREAKVELDSRDAKSGLARTGTSSIGSPGTSPDAPPVASPHGAGGVPPAAPDGKDPGPLNAYGKLIQTAADAARRGDPAAAEVALREAVKQRPDDVAALSFLAETLLFQNKGADARTVAEQALAVAPKDPQALWILGLVLIRAQQDVGRGVELWRTLVKLDPVYASQVGVTQALEEADKLRQDKGSAPLPK